MVATPVRRHAGRVPIQPRRRTSRKLIFSDPLPSVARRVRRDSYSSPSPPIILTYGRVPIPVSRARRVPVKRTTRRTTRRRSR